jgi:shikimate kinase
LSELKELTDSKPTTLVLVGPPGSGKSSVGRQLGKSLGWWFLDLDDMIEKLLGCSVAEYFVRAGEPAFRKKEKNCLHLLADQPQDRTIIATGGGIMTTAGNFELMLQIGEVVCLQASHDTLVARLRGDNTRPLLATNLDSLDASVALNEKIAQLLSTRKNVYALAKHQIATDGLTPSEVADLIRERLQI